MICSFDDFAKRVIGHNPAFIKSLQFHKRNPDIVCYEDGALEVSEEYVLSPCFRFGDGSNWGYYCVYSRKSADDHVTLFVTGADDASYKKHFESYSQASDFLQNIPVIDLDFLHEHFIPD